MLRTLLSAAAGLALFGATQVGRVAQNRRYDRGRRVLDDAQIPHPTVARLVSLGHTEWAVDLLWINATLYYSDTLYARLPSRYLRSYTRVMVELDPRFRQAYLWGALALVYRTSTVTVDDVVDAVGVLRQGIDRFPDDPELRGQLGIYLGFELLPRLQQQSDAWRRARAEAAEALNIACEAGWGPPWMPLAAANLLADSGRSSEAVSLLQNVIYRVSDEAVRRRMEERIASLRGASRGEDALTETLRSLDARRRAEAPWLPAPLYVFVGSSPLQRRGRGPLGVTPARD